MKKQSFTLGFQGWFLTEPYTGIGKHCIGLLRALAKEKNVTCLVPVPRPVSISGIPKQWIHVLPAQKTLLGSLKKAYWERVQVPAFFAQQNLDAEYYPYPCPLPSTTSHKRAMTVHDLILWEDERYKGGPLKQKYYRDSRRSLVHVDELFTVSKTIHKELGIPAARVLYNAVEVKPSKNIKKDLNKWVYVGGYDVRKKVPELVEAFLELRKKHPELHLDLLGSPLATSKLYPSVPHHPSVHRVGRLSDAELQKKIEQAGAFIHASDSEGFNLPLLEAMSLGVPAIVRDLPVNREISGGKALFWNPSKKQDLTRIIKKLEDPHTRREVIQNQKKVAKNYDWARSAKLLLQTLKS